MRILLATLGVMVVAVAPASAVPTADFNFAPATPLPGQTVTFTPAITPDADALTTVDWDFANNGDPPDERLLAPPFEQPQTHAYAEAGTYQARMLVRDAGGEEAIVVKPVRVNAPPVAQFSFSPTAPVVGQEVLFQSFSLDPGGSSPALAWDTDGDGFDDGTLGTASRTFTSHGPKQVRLRATDSDGVAVISSQTINVSPAPANPLPVAQFAVSPLQPDVGEQVSLRSFSYDPSGSIVSQRWDLDGDGDFDENVAGPTAFTTFLTPGAKIVRLRVEDSSGGVQTETVNITVRPVRSSTGPSLMYPFPVIRLAGSVNDRGARVRTLEVRAPSRSKITVICSGKGCPAKRFGKTSATRSVRFKRMRGFLRAGTVVRVSVRKGNLIGKHTRWLIRAGKPPKRTDLCVFPGRAKPARCPSS